jgi:transposase-like protein
MKKCYVCDDCCFTFMVFAEVRRTGLGMKKPFYCPNCGDNAAVREYTETSRTETEYKRLRWSPKEVEMLRRSFEGGMPVHQIAIKLGRSYNSTNCKITKMGLRGNA